MKVDSIVLEKIRNANIAFRKIKFNYFLNNKTVEITLNPYGIIISDKYYLVGFNEYVNDFRLYKIDKITNLEILDEYFDKDENFSLQKYSENSFGIYQETPLDIVLEFNAEVKDDVLNYHFHPTQKIKELPNGNIQVKFTSGGTHAICQELFKWGTDVKIKKPVEFMEYYKVYLSDVLSYL